jgi:exodeoxyribonuclease VII large subunit
MGQKIDFHKHALVTSMENCLKGMRSPLSLLEKRLTDLSPLSVLKRGYSITRRLPEKTVIRNCFTLNKGDRVKVLLSEGEIECRVEKITGEQTKI